MQKAVIYAVFLAGCAVLLSCGPASENVELTQLAADIEFDAWVTLGPSGEVLDRGMEVVGEPKPIIQKLSEPPKESRPAIEGALAAKLDGSDDDAMLDVLIGVRTTHRMSRLPPFWPGLPRDDPENLKVLAERERIQAEDEAMRARERAPVRAALEALGGTVKEETLVGNAIVASVRAGALRKLLAARPDIAAVELTATDAPPAAWSYISVARTKLNSDTYVNAGYDGAYYYLGLLDTGIYEWHIVFYLPDHVLFYRDCWGTDRADCLQSSNPAYHDLWNPHDTYNVLSGGHGTGNGHIVVGNGNLGNSTRGVAPGGYIDSLNVYANSNHNVASRDATIRAFNYMDIYDHVIMPEVAIADDGMHNGVLALAADDLFDAGVAVIAPVGNGAGYALSPAVAHKVIGVGPFIADTGEIEFVNNGTSDYRIKPDILGPSTLQVASSIADTGLVNRNGTCPAAASVGGAALLLWDFLATQGFSVNAGIIYAGLIAFGDRWGTQMQNGYGAGRLKLGNVANAGWITGSRNVAPGSASTIQFYVPAGACDFRAAIWYSEDASENHQIVSLDLKKDSTTYASSYVGGSVFQKVMYAGPMAGGWWILYIFGNSTNYRSVTVYYLGHWRYDC